MLNLINQWAPTAGIIIALATLAATILVARNTNHLSRQMHIENQLGESKRSAEARRSLLRHLKSEIREELVTFESDAASWRTRALSSGREPLETPPNGAVLLAKVEKAGRKPEFLSGLLKTLEGHSYWMWNPMERRNWIAKTFGTKETPHEWTKGCVNSVLDVVKDYVLDDSDHKFIPDEFWSQLDGDHFDENRSTETPDARELEQQRKSSIERWSPMGAEPEVQSRIAALASYKATLEHSLTLVLKAEYVGNNQPSRDERFSYAMSHAFAQLVAEVGAESTQAIDLLDVKSM